MLCIQCGSTLSRYGDGVGYCPICPGISRAVVKPGEVRGKPLPLNQILSLKLLRRIAEDRVLSQAA